MLGDIREGSFFKGSPWEGTETSSVVLALHGLVTEVLKGTLIRKGGCCSEK